MDMCHSSGRYVSINETICRHIHETTQETIIDIQEMSNSKLEYGQYYILGNRTFIVHNICSESDYENSWWDAYISSIGAGSHRKQYLYKDIPSDCHSDIYAHQGKLLYTISTNSARPSLYLHVHVLGSGSHEVMELYRDIHGYGHRSIGYIFSDDLSHILLYAVCKGRVILNLLVKAKDKSKYHPQVVLQTTHANAPILQVGYKYHNMEHKFRIGNIEVCYADGLSRFYTLILSLKRQEMHLPAHILYMIYEFIDPEVYSYSSALCS